MPLPSLPHNHSFALSDQVPSSPMMTGPNQVPSSPDRAGSTLGPRQYAGPVVIFWIWATAGLRCSAPPDTVLTEAGSCPTAERVGPVGGIWRWTSRNIIIPPSSASSSAPWRGRRPPTSPSASSLCSTETSSAATGYTPIPPSVSALIFASQNPRLAADSPPLSLSLSQSLFPLPRQLCSVPGLLPLARNSANCLQNCHALEFIYMRACVCLQVLTLDDEAYDDDVDFYDDIPGWEPPVRCP